MVRKSARDWSSDGTQPGEGASMRTWWRLPVESSDTAGEANWPGTMFGGGFGAAQPVRPMHRISARLARVIACAGAERGGVGLRRDCPVAANFKHTSETAVLMTTGYNTQTLGVKQNATSCHRPGGRLCAVGASRTNAPHLPLLIFALSLFPTPHTAHKSTSRCARQIQTSCSSRSESSAPAHGAAPDPHQTLHPDSQG